MTSNPKPPSLDVVYEQVQRRLEAQLDQVDTIDTKTGTVLSASSVVMALAAGLQAAASDDQLGDLSLVLLVAGTCFYLLTALFAFRGYWLRNFRRDPEPKPLRDLYLFRNPDFTKRRIIANMIESYEINRPLIESKVWNTRVAIIFFAFQTVFLAIALVSQTW